MLICVHLINLNAIMTEITPENLERLGKSAGAFFEAALAASADLSKPAPNAEDSNKTTENPNVTSYIKQLSISKDSLEQAHAIALDVRKFEIELYWKRSAYFWAIIAATVGAYGLLLSSSFKDGKTSTFIIQFMLFGLSIMGFVFSRAWQLVNKGSKFWQANWEAQVEVLEDKVVGPIYKTVFSEHSESISKTLEEARATNDLAARASELSQGDAFARIYSPTKINDLMAEFFLYLFGYLIIISGVILLFNLFQPILFSTYKASWLAYEPYVAFIAKVVLLLSVIVGGLRFWFSFYKCYTTTPMAHNLNMTQRKTSIGADMTEDLINFENHANHKKGSFKIMCEHIKPCFLKETRKK